MILKKHNKSNKNNLTILTLALVIGGVMQGVAAQDFLPSCVKPGRALRVFMKAPTLV